jgi:hypothetical protein
VASVGSVACLRWQGHGHGHGHVGVPVPAEMGDASSPAGLFSSIDEPEGSLARAARFRRQRRNTTSPTMARKPSVPPTAPPMTALRLEEPPPPEPEDGDAEDVDRGAVEDSKMLRSLKYSYWSGRSQYVGSSLPSGQVELFMHGSSLQQPLVQSAEKCLSAVRVGHTRMSELARRSRKASVHRMIHLEIDCQEQSNDQLDAGCRRDIRSYTGLPCSSPRTSCRPRTCTYGDQHVAAKDLMTPL